MRKSSSIGSILPKIYGAALKFLIPLTAEETYKTIVNEATQLVDGQNGSIILKQKGVLKMVYASSPVSYKVGMRRGGAREEVFKKQEGRVLHVKQIKKLRKITPDIEGLRAKSIIIVPLTNQTESIGILTIMSREDRHFSKSDLEVLKLFGSLASLAIRKTQLYDEVKQSLETRDLFISMAAHELRTPLTSVNGYIQLVKGKTKTDQKIPARWIDELEFETNRLKNLVEEFLEINRIRTGKLKYDWTEENLKKIVKRAISTFQFSKPDRKVILIDKIKDDDSIIGDKNKLTQLFVNIVENASKYSPPEKDIKVTMDKKDGYFEVDVEDQGQGIPKEDLSKVFRGFYKGKNSLHEGMGLGLYLAKNIVEQHHGEININSRENEGTKVKIELPVKEND